MKSPVGLLHKDAVVLRAHVSAHGLEERLDGRPVDVLRAKGVRPAQGGPGHVLKSERERFRGLVEGLAERAVALQCALGRPGSLRPTRALCLDAPSRCLGLGYRGLARTLSFSFCLAACAFRSGTTLLFLFALPKLSGAGGRLPEWAVALELGDLAAGLCDEFFVYAQLF